MKTLLYSLALSLVILYSCSNNPVTTTNPPVGNSDTNLIFSTAELSCDFHDSLYINDSNFVFYDSLKYFDTSRTFTKIKIVFDIQSSFDSLTDASISVSKIHSEGVYTMFDTTTYFYGTSNTLNNTNHVLLLGVDYPVLYSFYIKFYLELYAHNFPSYFYPKHSDYIKFRNIKVFSIK